MLNRVLGWVLDHKVITCLSVLLFSFSVATLALALEKEGLWVELNACTEERDALLDNMTTTITSSPDSVDTSPVKTTKEELETNLAFRLDPNIVPTSYDILLNPNLDTDTFEGEVSIALEVWTAQSVINVHSYLLEWDTAVLLQGTTQIPTTFSYNSNYEIYEIVPSDGQIEPSSYILTITYHANLTGDVGFYHSTLNDGSKIATSKFEPTYARQAFPCFDEPGMKAPFSVKIVRPTEGFIALSNMDVLSEVDNDNGLTTVTFRESVPMSTYLACFIVCNFTYKEDFITQPSSDFSLRVYAVSEDELHKVDFSLDIGKRVTEYYIDYFNIDYPLPKLDMIGIPDFVSGAMEHWGLVTFRETSLLYDAETTSTATRQNIAGVVAHEISHMWFGNLVTMAWWNELWLNEGFASYMQYKALDVLYPEWKMLEQFISANTHTVMTLDATLGSHPIVVTVETPDEITAIFDTISYNKGAAVLRMLEGFVGTETFRRGVTDYLNGHMYNNSVTQNLLDKLSPYYTEQNITHIMNTWTRQTGYPVVTVVANNDGSYTLTQQRFRADPNAVDSTPSDYNYRWSIPITYTTTGGAASTIEWFHDTAESLTITPPNGETILKLNNDQVGYYRVNYPDSMWERIQTELVNANTELSISDKANILNDVFNLAEAGHVEYSRALALFNYLSSEVDNYVPWAAASALFTTLNRIMSNSLAYTDFQAHVRALLSNIVSAVGWENPNTGTEEEHIVKMTRSVVLSLACAFGQEECLSEARSRFVEWLQNSSPIDPDIKGVVYYYGVERTDDTEWLQFYERYLTETDAQEKLRMMQSLAASRSPARLKWYLQMAWDTTVVRSQDYFSVVQYISANPVGTSIVWDYFRENWNNIVDRFGLNSRVLGTTVPVITRTFATNQKLQEMVDFFTTNSEAGAGAAARVQALEQVQNNIKWMERNEPQFSVWLGTSGKK